MAARSKLSAHFLDGSTLFWKLYK